MPVPDACVEHPKLTCRIAVKDWVGIRNLGFMSLGIRSLGCRVRPAGKLFSGALNADCGQSLPRFGGFRRTEMQGKALLQKGSKTRSATAALSSMQQNPASRWASWQILCGWKLADTRQGAYVHSKCRAKKGSLPACAEVRFIMQSCN